MKTILPRLVLATVLATAFASAARAQITLVSETFGGGTETLNGTGADTFASAITLAGGGSAWRTPDDGSIRADGSIAGTTNGAAYLNLGTYINDARGTADGLFTLTATMTKPTGGTWTSLGFFRESTNDNSLSGGNFTGTGLVGYATAIHRTSDGGTSTNFFAGPQSNNAFNPGNLTTTVTFKIELDFTPAGGYNGTNNFGTVRFYNPADTTSVSWTYTYTTAVSIEGIGITYAGAIAGGVDNLTLTQATIPEPSSVATLAGIGLLGFAAVRRRRAL